MAPFDAELYLRLLGERELIARGREGRNRPGSDLVEAARALIQVGAIEPGLAGEVIDGYSLAQGLREGRGIWRRKMASQAAAARLQAAVATPSSRTVVCAAKLERPTQEIEVRTVTLGADETRITVTVRELGRSRRGPHRMRGGPPPMNYSYPITDDRGGRFTTSVSMGGGNDFEWRGRLTTDRPLAMDTEWIEFDGTRIELVDMPSSCAVGVEPVPGGEPARDYVWFCLAAPQWHGSGGVEAAIDALIAAGSLTSDEPEIEAMRELAEGSWRHRGMMPTATPANLAAAPAEWRSLMQPARGRAARGTVPFHVVTPPFDGFRLTVSELEAEEGGWGLQFDISPGIMINPFHHSLDGRRVAFWAVDDHGQHYLGDTGQYSSNGEETSGTLQFQPPLDRRAKRLTLLPTGPSERARIELPLDWGEA